MPILRLDVPEGQHKPYCTDSGTYKIRSAGQNIAVDPPRVTAMILETESSEFVGRFKAAADEVSSALQMLQRDISGQIDSVSRISESAAASADQALGVAQDLMSIVE